MNMLLHPLAPSLKVVVVLDGRGDNIDETAIQRQIQTDVDNISASVSTRTARLVGDVEVVAQTRTDVLLEEQVEGIVNVVREQMRMQPVQYTVREWRVSG